MLINRELVLLLILLVLVIYIIYHMNNCHCRNNATDPNGVPAYN